MVFLCVSDFIMSQDLVISKDKKEKIGFATKDGEIVIPHEYSTAEPFVNGVAKVSINDLYGFIDTKGNEILPIEYSYISPFKYGVAVIEKKGKKGLINSDYKIIAEPIYTAFGKISESDYIYVNLNGKRMKNLKVIYGGKSGLITKTGKVIIPVEKVSICIFSNDSVYVVNDTLRIPTKCDYFAYTSSYKSTGLEVINKNSKVLLPENSYSLVYAPRNGRIVFTHTDKNTIQQGFYDIRTKKGHVIFEYIGKLRNIKAEMKSVIRQFVNNRAVVMNNNGEVYLIDGEGQQASDKYSLIQPILIGDESAYIGKSFGSESYVLMDDEGEAQTNPDIYSRMEAGKQISKIWVAAQRDGKWGILDEFGNETFTFEYDDVYDFAYDRVKVRKGVSYGLYDNNKGAMIVPCEFKDVKQADCKDVEYVWVKKNDALWYRYNVADSTVSDVGYKDVLNYKNNVAYVKPKNIKGHPKFVVYAEKDQSFIMVDNKDNVIMQTAISKYLINLIGESIMKYKQEHGIDKFTLLQERRMLLELTKSLRSYPLQAGEIDESQWDY